MMSQTDLSELSESAPAAALIDQRRKLAARHRRKYIKTIRRLSRRRGRPIRVHWGRSK